jgi:hypothetical protein
VRADARTTIGEIAGSSLENVNLPADAVQLMRSQQTTE